MKRKEPTQPENSSPSNGEAEIGEITRFLQEWKKGDKGALAEIIPKVVEDFRKIAHKQFRQTQRQGADRPTELIGMVWEKLNHLDSVPNFENSKQFYAYCARIIKNLLRDGIRYYEADKRDGQLIHLDEFVDLPILRDTHSVSPEDQAIVFELLDRLEQEMKDPYDVFMHKKILGFKDQETAKILGIAISTVQMRYSLARAWLYKELNMPT